MLHWNNLPNPPLSCATVPSDLVAWSLYREVLVSKGESGAAKPPYNREIPGTPSQRLWQHLFLLHSTFVQFLCFCFILYNWYMSVTSVLLYYSSNCNTVGKWCLALNLFGALKIPTTYISFLPRQGSSYWGAWNTGLIESFTEKFHGHFFLNVTFSCFLIFKTLI